MPTFHHSGTSGDLLSSLPAIRHKGGGELLLHLHNTCIPAYQQGPNNQIMAGLCNAYNPERMNIFDISFLEPLIMNTGFITKFRAYETNDKVDYDLDRFRLYLEKFYFGSIIDLHFLAVGQQDYPENKALQREAHLKPFLKVNNIRKTLGKYIGVGRTSRHRDDSPDNHYFWQRMVDDGLDEIGLFFGLPQEHAQFEDIFKIKIQYVPTSDALELAEHIAGVECFVCSSSMNYWIATGLQKTTILETRQTLNGQPHKWSVNECNNRRPHGVVMPYKSYME